MLFPNIKPETYVSRKITRRTARSTVIQPRGGAWSGRTISSRSPSRHHYRSPPDSRSSPRRISPTAWSRTLGDARERLVSSQLNWARGSHCHPRGENVQLSSARKSPLEDHHHRVRAEHAIQHRRCTAMRGRRGTDADLSFASCITSSCITSKSDTSQDLGITGINSRHKTHPGNLQDATASRQEIGGGTNFPTRTRYQSLRARARFSPK